MATLRRKHANCGLIEIRDSSVAGWYALYINGELKEQSADFIFILRLFDSY